MNQERNRPGLRGGRAGLAMVSVALVASACGTPATPSAEGRVSVVPSHAPSVPTASPSPQLKVSASVAPASGSFTVTGSMSVGRYGAAMARLADGQVLVVAGIDSTAEGLSITAEVYTPSSGTWKPVALPDLATILGGARLTPLLDGSALVTQHAGPDYLFDPVTNHLTPASPAISDGGFDTATLLADGRVLLAGGLGSSSTLGQILHCSPRPRSTSRPPGASCALVP